MAKATATPKATPTPMVTETSIGKSIVNGSIESGYYVGQFGVVGYEAGLGFGQGVAVGFNSSGKQYANIREAKLAELRNRVI